MGPVAISGPGPFADFVCVKEGSKFQISDSFGFQIIGSRILFWNLESGIWNMP